MSGSSASDKIRAIETEIKAYVKGHFGADIDGVPWQLINGLNGQPGLYINFEKINKFTKGYWETNFTKVSATMPAVPTVLVDTGVPDRAGTLWMGVLFHEYGHAAMDKLGKNSEPAAYTVELLSLYEHVKTNSSAADKVKIFVKDRRKNKQYSGFLAGYEEQAKSAYSALAGQAFV
ncbi:MAG: hypothetical protein ACREFJ_05215 [Acetobacteraceae bacterium]